MPPFTFFAPSAHSAGFIFILQDNAMFWWRVSTQGSHFQGEDMRTLAQGKIYILTAFIFLPPPMMAYKVGISETLRKTGSLI